MKKILLTIALVFAVERIYTYLFSGTIAAVCAVTNNILSILPHQTPDAWFLFSVLPDLNPSPARSLYHHNAFIYHSLETLSYSFVDEIAPIGVAIRDMREREIINTRTQS